MAWPGTNRLNRTGAASAAIASAGAESTAIGVVLRTVPGTETGGARRCGFCHCTFSSARRNHPPMHQRDSYVSCRTGTRYWYRFQCQPAPLRTDTGIARLGRYCVPCRALRLAGAAGTARPARLIVAAALGGFAAGAAGAAATAALPAWNAQSPG